MQVFRVIFRSGRNARLLAGLAALAALAAFFSAPRPLRSDNFLIYQPASRTAIPIQVIDKVSYVPLLSVLNAVGKVGAIQEKRNSLKVWFGEVEIEVKSDDKRLRLGKAKLDLNQPVRKPGSQWLVPVEFLSSALPRLTKLPLEHRPGSNRIFLGDVRPVSLAVRLESRADGVRVAVQLSEKVNIRTTSTDGKWHIYLGDRPVQPTEAAFHLQDAYVSDIRFDDQDGRPKLIITPSVVGLNFLPTVSDGGKMVLADIVKPAAAPAPIVPGGSEQAQTPVPAPGTGGMTGTEETISGTPGPPLPVVVLDAAHGGDDTGARGRDGILEKDITAQLASRVRLALIAGRKFRIQLTRTGDVNASFEQREVAANMARPVAFLSFHAGSLGNTSPRVAVFSYRSVEPDATPPPALLVPWDAVHRLHAERSQRLAQSLQTRIAQISGLAADSPVEAPVRSLRSIDCPAVAIELGSLNPAQDSGPLTSVTVQQAIATAIVAGLESFRSGAP